MLAMVGYDVTLIGLHESQGWGAGWVGLGYSTSQPELGPGQGCGMSGPFQTAASNGNNHDGR